MSNDINMEAVVTAYLALRNEREALKSKYETEDEALKSQMQTLEQTLLAVCNEVNANSINTPNGTVIRKMNERFFCNDWDNFKKFVAHHNAIDLLERRIHQGNFKQFMSEHEGEGLPPGVNVLREFGITVRKPQSSSH